MTLDSTVIACKGQTSSDLGGAVVILNLEKGAYHGLNEAGALIWSLVQQPRTVLEIRNAIMDEYDVDQSQCEQDLLAVLDELASHKLIEVRPA